MTILEQDMARATVDLMDLFRADAGHEAAERALEILREGRKRIG